MRVEKNERSLKSPQKSWTVYCAIFNSEYEPDTMSSFSRNIQRFLDDNNAKVNILKDEEFKVSREVLKSKRRELRKQDKGNKLNATMALTNEDVERIFEENQFGVHEPEVLARSMWFY